MDATEQHRIYLTAIRQAKQAAEPTKAEEGERLILEALAAFLDPNARIDLRQWIRSARAYLGTAEPTTPEQATRRAVYADMGRI